MDANKQKFIINAHAIDNMISDYHWMIETIEELREKNKTIDAPTASYGEEARMPKGGGISDPVYQEYLRREKRSKIIEVYFAKVLFVQSMVNLVKEDRESEVLYWLLEGESMRSIGSRMGLSHTTIQNIKSKIIDRAIQNKGLLKGAC
ncbi:LuxR C-terminal-related transcriptional regulator [Rummeliibacillus sp. NPDC094406]|uniref:LuxR C-terminal-related transcriptional regulator n=1 Tax=Rummeliibacillus sp. NPDC094406 TaxID=3364511 RepID=UPI00382B7DE3